MPIKFVNNKPADKLRYELHKDIELCYCSNECLLREVNDSADFVSSGKTSLCNIMVLIENCERMLISLDIVERDDLHLLGVQSNKLSLADKLKSLIGINHAALMNVYKVCNCMAMVQIYNGFHLADGGMEANWKKLREHKPINETKIGYGLPFSKWQKWMRSLSSGLVELESNGLYHGDPFPFNVIIDKDEQPKWIDYGHITDDITQKSKDAWVFVLFTLLHTHRFTTHFSRLLLKNLAHALLNPDGEMLKHIYYALTEEYSDLEPINEIRQPGVLFAQAVQKEILSKNIQLNSSNIPVATFLKGCEQFFFGYINEIENSTKLKILNNLEYQRHYFQEQETLRLTVPTIIHERMIAEKQGEILTLNNQIKENYAQIDQIDSQLRASQIQIDQIDSQLRASQIQIDQIGSQLRTSQAQTELFQTQLQLKQLEVDAIYNSRSWRITKPLRVGCSIVKNKLKPVKVLKKIVRKIIPVRNTGNASNEKLVMQPNYPEKIEQAQRVVNESELKKLRFNSFKDALVKKYGKVKFDNCNGANKGKVSIILPVYNGEKYIKFAIESILLQTYQNFELIIVDDGSTDNTQSIIESYLPNPKIIILKQENKKLPSALNLGHSYACGEFVTWTSDDNILHPNCLKSMVDFLEKDLSADMVYANMNLIDDEGKYIFDHGWYNQKGQALVNLPQDTSLLGLEANNTIGACFLYRKYCYDVIGGYSVYRFGIEDYDFWMKLNDTFRIKHIGMQEALYDYRFHDSSLTSKDKALKITEDRYKLMIFEDARMSYLMAQSLFIYDDTTPNFIKDHLLANNFHCCSINDFCQLTLDNSCYLVAVYISSNYDSNKISKLKSCYHDTVICLYDQCDKIVNKIISVNEKDLSAVDLLFTNSNCDKLKEIKSFIPSNNINSDIYLIDMYSKYTMIRLLESRLFCDYSSGKSNKKLSIIVCTHNRNEKLKICLESMINQNSLSVSEYEVIVVNNDVNDKNVFQIVNELNYKAEAKLFRYIDAPVPGLSFARNMGSTCAEGKILYYVDDDAYLTPDSCINLISSYEADLEIGCIGGDIKLVYENPQCQEFAKGREGLWSQLIIETSHYSKDDFDVPWGANYSLLREVFFLSGGFRENYGRIGNDFAGGEEIIMSALVKKLKYKVYLDNKILVFHCPDANRYTEEHIIKTSRAGTIADYSMTRDLYCKKMELDFKLINSKLMSSMDNFIISKSLQNYIALNNNLTLFVQFASDIQNLLKD